MPKLATCIPALAAILALLAPVPARAVTNIKSWVSHSGSDGSVCTLAAPCATFQRAHDQTSPGGEIGVLNPGDYGRVAIAKAVSITNDGSGEAGVTVPVGFTAIFVAAGPGDVIGLRGLVVDGLGLGVAGIIHSAGSALHIQNCVIRNVAGPDQFAIKMVTTANNKLLVSDTIIFNNGSNANSGGILIAPNSGVPNVVLDRVHLENNVLGIRVDGRFEAGSGPHVTVRASTVSGNLDAGIKALTTPGQAGVFVFVDHATSVDNQTGILADGLHAIVLVNDSTISRNGTGVSAVNGGQVITYGNNRNNNNFGPEGAATGSFSLF